MIQFKGKEILITGCGTLGGALVKKIMTFSPRGIRVLSRNELHQYRFKQEMAGLVRETGFDNIAYLIGDVRDYERIRMATKNVDIVINTAAMKHLDLCEENPFEAVQTNIIGATNIIKASIDNEVEIVMQISTDKAVEACNLYGATKAVAEKLFIHGNVYTGGHGTKMSCCRYGNVIGSNGSVIPLFKKQAEAGSYITITHPDMTRFWISINEAVEFIIRSIGVMAGGEIFIPKIPSMRIIDLANAIKEGCVINYTGIRKGEKIHETLISEHESLNVIEYDESFEIRPLINIQKYDTSGNRVFPLFKYSSDTNAHFLSKEDLRELI